MWKVLWRGAVLVFVLLVSGVILLFACLKWPSLIINPRTVQWISEKAAGRARKNGIDVRWDSLRVHVKSASLLRKTVRLVVEGVAVQHHSSRFSGQAETLDVQVSLNVLSRRGIPELTQLTLLRIRDLNWKIGKVGSQFLGGATLEGASLTREEIFPLRVKVKGTLKGKVGSEEGSVVSVVSTMELTGERSPKGRVTGQVWKGLVSGKIRMGLPNIPEVTLLQCETRLRVVPDPFDLRNFESLRVSCPMQVRTPAPLRKEAPFPIPRFIQFKVDSELRFLARQSSLSESDRQKPSIWLDGPVDVSIAPTHILGTTFDGRVKGRIEGPVSGDGSDHWTIGTQFQVNLEVPEFQSLVQQLNQASLKRWNPQGAALWVVPAPFHVLKGKMNLEAKGEVDPNSGKAFLAFQSRLGSKSQVLDLQGQGGLSLKWNNLGTAPHLKLDLILSKLQLELPRLEWGIPPRIWGDPRIRREANEGHELFSYDIVIRTPRGKPARFLSNLAETPIPLQLNLRTQSGKALQGELGIESVPFDFLRKSASLERLAITFRTSPESSPIRGKLTVGYVDYQVDILILGTLGKPRILLRSDPPLPEQQLLSVLLFGKPMSELDSGQSSSIVDARAALADGAINLISLYWFASTPIQSINYDPLTGRVSAKVRLAEGTSLNLGKSSEEASIGIRKRLGKNWSLTTDYASSQFGSHLSGQSGNQIGGVGSAYIEWSKRY